MSMMSNVGSEIATKDVLKHMQKLYSENPSLTKEELMSELEKYCNGIIKACETGWY